MKSWKTTLLGAVAGAANLIASGVNWKTAVFSASLAALGALAKDYNVHTSPAATSTTSTMAAK